MADTIFLDQFSEEVWNSTYQDFNDNDVDQTFRRVAKGIAKAEKTKELQEIWEEIFYQLLTGFKGTPGGRILANAGTEWKGTTLMNCFVGPRIKYDVDSIEGIYSHLLSQTQTLKSEGGWGENFSYIRPRGAFIKGIGVESPGSVKYMELFDTASDVITSGSSKKKSNVKAKNKIRKGAMMGVMDVWHPDIIEFITAKQSQGRLSKFNISANCTDEFMEKVILVLKQKKDLEYAKEHPSELYDIKALEEIIRLNDQWDLRFPDTTFKYYKEEWFGSIEDWESKGYPVKIYDTISVTGLWDLIMESTYNRNEPGVLFLDRANYYNPLNYRDTIYATNPCGEQTLAPGGVCDLGSINLTQFVIIDSDGCVVFDFDAFEKAIPIMVRFLDNVNDISDAPLKEYQDSMKKKRRIGVGILGWGSLLMMLKIRFASEQAAELRNKIMHTLAQEAYKASIDLAIEKGMFEFCNPLKHAENAFVKSLGLPESYMEKLRTHGIRNSSLLSIQPTGNTSVFANMASGGLEPIFNPIYTRTTTLNRVPEEIEDVTPKWYEGRWHETELFKFSKEGDEEILRGENNGVVYKIDKNRGLTKEVDCIDYGVRWLMNRGEWDENAEWAVSASDLTVDEHVSDMLGFAEYVDSAISKTVNLPNNYPLDDFKRIYLEAYQTGWIKGMTTYREGTMTSVLSVKDEKHAESDADKEIILDDVKLPNSAPAILKTIRAEGKKWYLTVVYYDGTNRPFAIFVKTNSHEQSVLTNNAIDLLFSLAEEKGIPQKHIDDVKRKIGGDNNPSKITRVLGLLLRHGVLIKNICLTLDKIDGIHVGSFVYQIKKFLETHIKEGEIVEGEKCGECGGKLIYSEGCFKCSQCGNSRC